MTTSGRPRRSTVTCVSLRSRRHRHKFTSCHRVRSGFPACAAKGKVVGGRQREPQHSPSELPPSRRSAAHVAYLISRPQGVGAGDPWRVLPVAWLEQGGQTRLGVRECDGRVSVSIDGRFRSTSD